MPELKRALSLGKSSSPGPDKIPPDFFRNLKPDQLNTFLGILNYFWNSGLPDSWKSSIVIPIMKHGKPPNSTSSYRPISLTNSSCKILERMISFRLKLHLEQNSLTNKFQSGFRSRFSTTDNIVRLENSIRLNTLKSKATLTVFLDLNQAFDSVHHDSLLNKIASLGITGNLACFIKDFLSNRSIRVRYNGTFSNSFSVPVGVPQGSVISPTLFTMMIDDIFNDCPDDICYSLYADDLAIWTSCVNLNLCMSKIQSAIDMLCNWGNIWGLSFAPNKTKAIFFTRRRIPQSLLKLNGSDIEFVTPFKFLGVVFDKSLTWKPHILNIKAKCEKDLRIMRITSHNSWGADFSTLKMLYTAYILPKINYCSFIYNSCCQVKSANSRSYSICCCPNYAWCPN